MKNEEKTILEWFNQLPEPYMSQAIENAKNNDQFYGNEIVGSLAEAIGLGFIWHETPQNFSYWNSVHADVKNGEFHLPPIPWPEEATLENAPEGVFARAVNSDGRCYHYMLTPQIRLFEASTCVESRRPCGQIPDMTGIDWKQSLELKP